MKKKYFNSRLNLVELTNPLYWVLIVFISVFTSFKTAAQTTFSSTTTGQSTWIVPCGVTSITVEAWGGGGAGGGSSANNVKGGGGGAGGSYASSVIAVSPGQSISYSVGAGASGSTTAGSAGQGSWIISNTTVFAKGGAGGSAPNNGTANGGIGSTTGSFGTILSAGTNGKNGTTTIGGAGGDGSNPTGGPGGASISTGGNGNFGSSLGGGGGGAFVNSSTNRIGGDGGDGQIKITFTPPYLSQFISMSYGTTNWCAGETRNVTVQIKNIGTATWTDATPDINIGVKWNTNGTFWTDYYVRVNAGNLAPGATGTYTLPITASNATASPNLVYGSPLTVGTNNLTFDVGNEGVSWFADNTNCVGPGNVKFTSPNINIVAPPINKTVAATAATICSGVSTTITVAASLATTSYQLRNNSDNSLIGSPVTGTGGTISLPTGILAAITTFNVLATTGCSLQMSITPTITVNTLPTLFNVTGTGSYCSGGSGLAVGIDGSSVGINYQLYNGGTLVGSVVAGTGFPISFGLKTGTNTYTVIATNASTGCKNTMTGNAVVTVRPNFTSGTIVSTGETICYNGDATLIGSSTAASGGDNVITYKWQANGIDIASSDSANYNPPTGLTTTTTYVRFAKDNSCNTTFTPSTGSWIVTVRPNFTSGTILSTGETICYNGDAGLIGSTTPASGGDNTITYKWQANGVDIVNPTSATYNPPTGLTTTTTYVRFAKDNTCNTTFTPSTGSWVVTVNPRPSIFNQTAVICSGSTFSVIPVNGVPTATTIVPAGTTYSWPIPSVTGGITGGSTQSNQSSISQTLANNSTTVQTATYTVTPTANGCNGNPFTVTVSVNPKPIVYTISDITYCNGVPASAISFSSTTTPSASVSYSWTSTFDVGFGFSGTGNITAFTAINTTNAAITATVTVIAAINGCSGIPKTFKVIVNPTPNATITANYCAVAGKIQLTAAGGGTYLWSTGETTNPILVDVAGVYSVTVTLSTCTATTFLNVAQELVVNGSFTQGNTGFASDYNYHPDVPVINNELFDDTGNNGYGVGTSGQNYHPIFWGIDHTNNANGSRNFMLVNGHGSTLTIWQQTVTVQPNTDYYFSAWAMSLNNIGPYAQLQFQVNGINVGTTATLGAGPSSSVQASVNNYWTRFYSDTLWNSGALTSVTIKIVDLQSALTGNDFALDDISFGTLAAVPFYIAPTGNSGSNTTLCTGQTFNLFTNLTNGKAPITYSWTGPNGFTSNLANPSISNVTTSNTGNYKVTVADGYGCGAQSGIVALVVNPRPTAAIQTSQIICNGETTTFKVLLSGTAPWNITYSYGTTPISTTTTTSTNPFFFSIPNITTNRSYTITALSDANCTANPADLTGTSVVTVLSGTAGLWTGSVSTDWFDCHNWAGGLPSNTIDAQIPTNPSGGLRMPVIDRTSPLAISYNYIANARDLLIAPGASVTMVSTNNSELQISRDWKNNGQFISGTGTVTFNGAALNQIQNINLGIKTNETFYNLNTNNSSGAKGISVVDGFELMVKNNLDLISGDLRLTGEAQLVQEGTNPNPTDGTGKLLRDQQGQKSSYNYNYWSSPVNSSADFAHYSISGILKDGTNVVTNPFNQIAINFGNGVYFADGVATIPIKISNQWLYSYNSQTPDSNTGLQNYFLWNAIGNTGQIKIGEGFTMKGVDGTASLSSIQNYVFVGKPNSGTIALNLPANQTYLIGNPYPSALDADEFIRDNLLSCINCRATTNVFNGALYFWDHFGLSSNHYLAQYVGGYATYTLMGGVIAISNDPLTTNNGLIGSKIPERYIPVSQGFFVDATIAPSLLGTPSGVSGGILNFKNTQRAFVRESPLNSTFMKTSGTYKTKAAEIDTRQKIRLGFYSSIGSHRQILVGADSHTTSLFDFGYDAPMNDSNGNDMFWKINDIPFVIQAVPDFNTDRIIPIGVKIANEGAVTFKIDALENIPSETQIYLHDAENGTYNDIQKANYTTSLAIGKYNNRFSLRFIDATLNLEESKLQNGIIISYSNNYKILTIKNNLLDTTINAVNILNILGQELAHWSVENREQSNIQIPIKNSNSGIFIVKVKTTKGEINKKIIFN